MHKIYKYTSCFSELITQYISERRNAGYMFDNPAYWLYRFDQYCTDNKIQTPAVTKELYQKWASFQTIETKATQNNRLQALRGFSVYLNTIRIVSYIPHVLSKAEKNVPYLMEDTDIHAFFEQVDLYNPLSTVDAFNRMATEYKVLFRMIYCCGLRSNEACSLKTENVDVINCTLTIIHSKGDKDRVVYLSDDMRILCHQYRTWIAFSFGIESEWFFPGKYPEQHIPKTSVDRKFNGFWNATEISKHADKKPTVHCLRHTFVIKCMNQWIKADMDLKVMRPYLSRYLGHKGPIETYYYYHQVQDVFESIRKKDIWYVADGNIEHQQTALAVAHVPFLKNPEKVKEVLSEECFNAILLAPDNSRIGIRDTTIMVILYDSAIRLSELTNLKTSDVNLKKSTPYLRIHGKGDKERIVSISDNTVAHLQQYLLLFHQNVKSGTEHLFYTIIHGKANQMSPGNVERIINKYADMIRGEHPDLPKKVHPHMFRRTRATNLYQSNIELELVSRILGGSSTQTTRIYTKPSLEMIKNAMDKSVNAVDVEEPMWPDDEDELARMFGLR